MSVGDMGGVPAASAGSPLQQRHGVEADRRAKETADQRRQTENNLKAEKAAGIGETSQDAEASDRDADGRRLWEQSPQAGEQSDPPPDAPPRKSKDPQGESGGRLDLTG